MCKLWLFHLFPVAANRLEGLYQALFYIILLYDMICPLLYFAVIFLLVVARFGWRDSFNRRMIANVRTSREGRYVRKVFLASAVFCFLALIVLAAIWIRHMADTF